MKKYLQFILFSLIISFSIVWDGCKDDPVSSSDCPPENRTGAVCNDGTTSSSTGSGACSGHGGVDHWICR